MQRPSRLDTSVHAAALSAAAIIAHQVGGKATRDALFLSQFDVASLAWMVVAASVLAIFVGVAGARLMVSLTPARVIPPAFAVSAILLLVEWAISSSMPTTVAVLVYLQIAALGSALISGFWSLLGDRFDPHAARKQFGRVVAAGTFGGMIGGLLADRVGTTFGVAAMLPVLAALDLVCAFLTRNLGASVTQDHERPELGQKQKTSVFNVLRVLRDESHLRHLGSLVVFSTVGAGLLDYVFKARAVQNLHGGADLVSFFAIFYTAASVVTFLVQIGLSKASLEKLGLAGTIGSLPFMLAAGSVGGLFVPSLASAALGRGGESVLRSSLFRSGYELFFAAVPRRRRHEIKPILDVGFERLGDMLGGVMISILLIAGSARAIPLMLVIAGVTGVLGLWISQRLHHGYVKALETNLLNQSIHIEISDIRDSTTRAAVMQTLTDRLRISDSRQYAIPVPPQNPKTLDAVVQRVADLRSSDPDVVRHALKSPLDATLAAHAIGLLAWNAVANEAVCALQKIAPVVTGQLVDALLDPNQEFSVRRRIPRVLAVADSRRAFHGLEQSLFDKRFEVRFQAGHALAQIQDRVPEISVDDALIIQVVRQEVSVGREVWESRSVIDADEHAISNVSSEHVFRLLSLILPRDPVKIAYRGLHSGDEHLKGMALEYFDSVLPAELRKALWPLLEANQFTV